MLSPVLQSLTNDFSQVYARLCAPIADLDCGGKCAPYNERGVPFCCDTRHAIPTAYLSEWDYLRANTDLWHLWEGKSRLEKVELMNQAPEGQVLIECQGYNLCQREYRAVSCRAFPFFPYITIEGVFIGLSYYWEYEHRCWVISNLHVVTSEFRRQFFDVFDALFESTPDELNNFRHHSIRMRRIFGRKKRAIPLLHRNGHCYKISPRNGRMRRVSVESMPKFEPYRLATELPFPDEILPVLRPTRL